MKANDTICIRYNNYPEVCVNKDTSTTGFIVIGAVAAIGLYFLLKS